MSAQLLALASQIQGDQVDTRFVLFVCFKWLAELLNPACDMLATWVVPHQIANNFEQIFTLIPQRHLQPSQEPPSANMNHLLEWSPPKCRTQLHADSISPEHWSYGASAHWNLKKHHGNTIFPKSPSPGSALARLVKALTWSLLIWLRASMTAASRLLEWARSK